MPRGRRTSKIEGLVSPPDSFQNVIKDESLETRNRPGRSSAPSVTSTFVQAANGHHRQSSADTIMPEATSGLEMAGSKVKILIDAISELRKYGLDHVAPLPELVLVGDQSSGKSSLMGALAGITLPKHLGMCTRSPANIKTAAADTWKCEVMLMCEYEYAPGYTEDRFPDWIQQASITTTFKTIYDKARLGDVVSWAQIALRNPDKDPKLFVPGEGDLATDYDHSSANCTAEYSPNTIFIEISGPNLQSLSFYDLPGIFQVPKNAKQENLVPAFEAMTRYYMERSNSQIIIALPMAHDIGNSRTLKLITESKTARQRCTGVLTMPDRLQGGGNHLEFEEALDGKAQVLPNGYFVTKQPGPEFPYNEGDSRYHQYARKAEEEFFSASPLWLGDWKRFRDRCGTGAILTHLSRAFANQIAESIPEISEKVAAGSQSVDTQLAALPEILGNNVLGVVDKQLSNFSNKIREVFDGTENTFLSSWTILAGEFLEIILAMKPKIQVSPPGLQPEIINVDDDSDGNQSIASHPKKRQAEYPATPINKRHRTVQGSGTPRALFRTPEPPSTGPKDKDRTMKRENGDGSLSPLQRRPLAPRSTAKQRQNPFSRFHRKNPGSNFVRFAEIRNLIEQHSQLGIPDYIDQRVRESYTLHAIANWRMPLDVLITEAFLLLRSKLFKVLDEVLGSYEKTELYRKSAQHLREYLETCEKEQRRALDRIFDLENQMIFTLNNKAFEANRNEELMSIESYRKGIRIANYLNNKFPNASEKELDTRTRNFEYETLGKDPLSAEVSVAAYTRGYYITAGMRFVDNICQSIQGEMFAKVKESLVGGEFLKHRLEILQEGGEERCRILVAEDSELARQRHRLMNERERLRGFSEKFAELQRRFYSNPGPEDVEMDMQADDAHSDVEMMHEPVNQFSLRGHNPNGI